MTETEQVKIGEHLPTRQELEERIASLILERDDAYYASRVFERRNKRLQEKCDRLQERICEMKLKARKKERKMLPSMIGALSLVNQVFAAEEEERKKKKKKAMEEEERKRKKKAREEEERKRKRRARERT